MIEPFMLHNFHAPHSTRGTWSSMQKFWKHDIRASEVAKVCKVYFLVVLSYEDGLHVVIF